MQVCIARLASTPIPLHNYLSVGTTFKLSSLSNFQVYRTVLASPATTLALRSSELPHRGAGSLRPLTSTSAFAPPPSPGNHCSTGFPWVWLLKIPRYAVFLCLAAPPTAGRFPHLCVMGIHTAPWSPLYYCSWNE